ncbi:hypothetical protein I5G63_gp059 [Mycobacterium phage Imvubu]|uniref:DUF7423 domain-containing protein n=1 Tax=Mycobacterium phage Imvubu TaxID=2686233 RepID=A0A6B9L859_9CAUD|nr:hypothetical protein I5G63_gp059 [Mycobacterium phage Imvubu]QHB37800.1 hypothetical protein PBI_IMVUBU_59 [Mycobacterium phage Imvubu]
MTDNLPAPGPRFGATDVPLSAAPTAVLAFALGAAVSRPVDANQFGPFCAMVEELMSRVRPGVTDPGPVGGYDMRTEFGVIMGLLPHDMARRIAMLYQAQRGQRWAATGRRHGTNPTVSGNS